MATAQRAISTWTATLTRVEKITSHSSTNPALAPSAVAVMSSPAPTIDADTMSPGPKNRAEASHPVGGSLTAAGSRTYGSSVGGTYAGPALGCADLLVATATTSTAACPAP